MNYSDFLKTKGVRSQYIPVKSDKPVSDALFPFQRQVVARLLEMGRAAAFLDTGLGKTIIQCEWANHIPGDVLIIAPLAVGPQTVTEAKKLLGLDLHFSRDGCTNGSKITVTNYERLHLFDTSQFAGVVLDESSILKSFMGKTKQNLCDWFSETPYRLACTATPAPNDHMELGNHSQFLGVMPSTEMLARWFINDPSQVGAYRLKGHAVKDFWQWVGSWSCCVSMPSDLGFSDHGYKLPELSIDTHVVESPLVAGSEGMLFDVPSVSATDLHATKRLTIRERCQRVASMVNDSSEPWLVWCESNAESAMLSELIGDAVEVKGSDTIENKESRLNAFTTGNARVLVSKPSICGFGMNWQHCRNIAFASISYSYESFYQAVRRCWRFGQKREVNVHVCIADAELPVWRAIERKALDHDDMKRHMRENIGVSVKSDIKLDYNPTKIATLPAWLKSETPSPLTNYAKN